eukprot:TRINITY_DN625_c0_g1_i1.p1 TRINITY_DN625_c0_g1~~TRINITY_DN625_c0_g1_i1.p1  ORF type:complete len:485 (+),score=83.07 TRINITY_DN625_c0_g1_i1:198-1652(+)
MGREGRALRHLAFIATVFVVFMVLGIPSTDAALEEVDFLRLKEGFKATYFAKDLPFGPRAMVLGDKGTLFVGERIPKGTLYAIKFDHKSYEISEIRPIAKNLFNPAAVLFRDGALYLGTTDKIYRWDDVENSLLKEVMPQPTLLFTFPNASVSHPVRYLTFSPLDTEGKTLYVNIGAPCDECEAPAPWGNLYAIDITAKKPKMTLVAKGIRTIVGLDWHPVTHEMYFSENGPAPWNGVDDLLNPNDEINILSLETINSGKIPDYGYPYCYGYNRPSNTYMPFGMSCWNYTPAYFELGAHVAPLGVKFYTGNSFPKMFKNVLFIAEHAPHVRNGKSYPRPFNLTIGHRITYLDFNVVDANGKPYYGTFADGWRTNNINPHDDDIIGAPVDFLLLPDGSMMVSDDQHKAIYRFEYVGSDDSGLDENGDSHSTFSQYTVSGIVIGIFVGVLGTVIVFAIVRRILRRRVEHIGETSSNNGNMMEDHEL